MNKILYEAYVRACKTDSLVLVSIHNIKNSNDLDSNDGVFSDESSFVQICNYIDKFGKIHQKIITKRDDN